MNNLHLEEVENNSLLIRVGWGDEWEQVVSKSLFARSLGKLRACRDKEEFLSVFRELELRIARAEAVRLLARKGYFSHEMRQKLLLKGLSEEAVSQVVQACVQKGYIDDAGRAQGVVRRELKKGHGLRYIDRMLQSKNVARGTVLATEEETSLRAYLRKQSSKIDLSDKQQRTKLIAKLLRRGYSYEMVRSVLDCKEEFEG